LIIHNNLKHIGDMACFLIMNKKSISVHQRLGTFQLKMRKIHWRVVKLWQFEVN